MKKKPTQPKKTERPTVKTTASEKQRSKQAPRVEPTALKPIELLDGMWDRIAQKAYELWEQRGRREGHALEEWLDAEEIVMEEIHEARE